MGDYTFLDRDREVQNRFYQLREEEQVDDLGHLMDQLKKLINEDPDFLEPYLVLEEIYLAHEEPQNAAQIRQKAFDRALNLITDENGNWPDHLPWLHLENRHIIRTILQQAISEWEHRNWEQALDLLRFLLISNPNDNIAARFYILAIRMGFTYYGFEDRFNKGGYYDQEVNEWFEEHVARFSEEFQWWLDWAEKEQ